LSTLTTSDRSALYYPFHLCHEHTLQRLLHDYRVVHFRDYMALQLTPMSGTTAYADRMGNLHEALVKEGRIVQGHSVSGPLDDEMIAAIDRDLNDRTWRSIFHEAFSSDRRFQRGLLDVTHGMRIGGTTVPGAAAVLELTRGGRRDALVTVQLVRALSRGQSSLSEGYDYEYGMALLKTSASLLYTIRLCRQHGLDGVTDSEYHFQLLEQCRKRESVGIANRWIKREGY
jgi:hypothetical protein